MEPLWHSSCTGLPRNDPECDSGEGPVRYNFMSCVSDSK